MIHLCLYVNVLYKHKKYVSVYVKQYETDIKVMFDYLRILSYVWIYVCMFEFYVKSYI